MHPMIVMSRLVGTALLATSATVGEVHASTIQHGSLELGDAIFFYDGSLYDYYPIEVQSGQAITVELRSYAFDPFLAIVGPQGEWLAHNNDVNSDNNNSALSFTFPDDGVYYIFVNTYSVTGQGTYVLELSHLTGSSLEDSNITLLTDFPPMPTPVLIQPSDLPDLEDDGDSPEPVDQISGFDSGNAITGSVFLE